mmetsp:Transcript_23774/g.70340  ORF Transcript_23774/g.70340 Transcript_23774/m.70340 type:complete len:366 (+) Transcript_23774:2039-3136(+)
MSSMWYMSLPRGLLMWSFSAISRSRSSSPAGSSKRSSASSFSLSACATSWQLRLMATPAGRQISPRKRRKRGACFLAASCTNLRMAESGISAHAERLSRNTAVMQPVGVTSYAIRSFSTCSTIFGIDGTRSFCICGKPETSALRTRYTARSTARVRSSSGRGRAETGSRSSCITFSCAPIVRSSTCMSRLYPPELHSSMTQVSPEPPGCSSGGVTPSTSRGRSIVTSTEPSSAGLETIEIWYIVPSSCSHSPGRGGRSVVSASSRRSELEPMAVKPLPMRMRYLPAVWSVREVPPERAMEAVPDLAVRVRERATERAAVPSSLDSSLQWTTSLPRMQAVSKSSSSKSLRREASSESRRSSSSKVE